MNNEKFQRLVLNTLYFLVLNTGYPYEKKHKGKLLADLKEGLYKGQGKTKCYCYEGYTCDICYGKE